MKFDEHPSVDAITMLTCDVTDEVPVKNRVTEVLKQAGCIDLLVKKCRQRRCRFSFESALYMQHVGKSNL